MKNKFYREIDLSQIKAKGWIAEFLKTQNKGMTGNIGKTGEPFSGKYWGATEEEVRQTEAFLGGFDIGSDNSLWVPFEQTGYWIDGMVKSGNLVDDREIIELAESKIIPVIKNASPDGYLGPNDLKEDTVWAHSVFFRAVTAYYTATHNSEVLEALKNHFLRRPLKDIYSRYNGARIIAVRNVADVEIALWIYGKTNDDRFLRMAEESYEEFNKIFKDDSSSQPHSRMKDVTVPGMLCNGKVNKNHGVTYCEICKLSAVMYLYTQKEKYKKAAINAFDKLYRDQMLIDGVFSSTEYLNGNADSHASHETCDISDFTWALGYLYMITGDTKYGDWIEDAVFNAGLGAVDDEFKGNQYFSCPNQVIADDTSNHLIFFKGEDWMSFAPKKFLGCCAGNVNRFMPNFVYRSVMTSDDGNVSFVTYAPCEVNLHINNTDITISEETNYPFDNIIKFKIYCEKPVNFGLVLRKPNWAETCSVIANGLKVDESGNQIIVSGTYNNNTEVTISFTDSIRLIYNAKGVSVKKGALLYALPIKEKVVYEGLRECGYEDLPRYSLYPCGKWNYAIDVKNPEFKFENKSVGEKPWIKQDNPYSISAKAFECPNMKIKSYKDGKKRTCPFAPTLPIGHPFKNTPVIRPVRREKLGERTEIKLVPYCTTRLRIAIFPYGREK